MSLAASVVACVALAAFALPAQATTGFSWKAVSGGYLNTCAIKADDSIACWGNNDVGETIPPAGAFKAISAGLGHTCAIKADDSLACWGTPNEGRTNAPSGSFKAVSAGDYHTCALRDDDSIACWGYDGNGQIEAPFGSFKAVSAGASHTCAIKADDSLACWGDNTSGQANPPAGSFKAVTGGYYHSCAIAMDDSVTCWGLNDPSHDYGQATAPTGSFKAITAGAYHTCGIKADDALACWGGSPGGDLGAEIAPPGTFKAVEAGTFHNCAIRTDDSLTCWGHNGLGQSTVPTSSADTDGDGVEDSIDVGAGQFNDGAGTTGSITDRAGLNVTVADEVAPDGVKVTVGAGTGKATLSVCGGFTIKVAAGSEVVVTCGSVKVHVLQGSAEVVLGGGLTVVSVPAGVTAKVSQNTNGSFKIENLGGGSLTVTVDGVPTTVGPGQTKTVTALDFQGFSSPVDNPTVLNVVKAGQAVPFKWRLLRPDGSPYTTLSSASMTASSLACTLGSTVDQIEEVAPGGSGLQNLGNGYYQLNWQTPKSYSGSCKALHLDLGEGVTRDAYFQFVK